MGADVAIDYHDDWAAAVKAATDGRGVDVILDVLGAKYLEPIVASLAVDGRLVVIGLQGGTKGTLDLGRAAPGQARHRDRDQPARFRPVDQKAAICAAVAERVWPLIEPPADQDWPRRPASRSSRSPRPTATSNPARTPAR